MFLYKNGKVYEPIRYISSRNQTTAVLGVPLDPKPLYL